MKKRSIGILWIVAAGCLALVLLRFRTTSFSVNASMQEELNERVGAYKGGNFLPDPVSPCPEGHHREEFASLAEGHYSYCSVCNETLSELAPHEAVLTYSNGYVIIDGKIYITVAKLCSCGSVYSYTNEPPITEEEG